MQYSRLVHLLHVYLNFKIALSHDIEWNVWIVFVSFLTIAEHQHVLPVSA
jgi:hypothetical protein